MWHSLVALLQAQGQLPAVAFTFSRGRCDAHAAALGRIDLSSAAEKGRVRGFVRRCLARLRGGDRRLPQVGALGGRSGGLWGVWGAIGARGAVNGGLG